MPQHYLNLCSYTAILRSKMHAGFNLRPTGEWGRERGGGGGEKCRTKACLNLCSNQYLEIEDTRGLDLQPTGERGRKRKRAKEGERILPNYCMPAP